LTWEGNEAQKEAVVVAGHVAIDQIIDSPDQVTPRIALGGSASYSALSLTSLGYANSIVTKVGIDFPEAWCSFLQNKGGIDIERFRVSAKTTSFRIDRSIEPRKLWLISRCKDISIVDFQNYIGRTSHDQTLVLNPIAGEISLSLLDRLSKEFDFVLVDSQGFVRRISKKTSEVSMHSGLDISSLSGVDVLKADKLELCAWSGSRDLDSSIRQISKFVHYILLTSGGESLDLLEDGKLKLSARPRNVHVEDTTGAGDIMLAVFGAEYYRTKDIKDALAKSVSAASLAVRKSGIEKAILNRNEVESSSKEVEIRSV
jgi:sugar/nucleoside kinase (ribokinase family)